MKQIWPNYSYSPATNVLTLTGLNIDRDQLLLVTAADRGRIMYNFADSSVTASAFTSGANTALTLVATTAGLTTTAALVIYYDDQVAGIAGTVTANVFGKESFGNTFVPIQIGASGENFTNGNRIGVALINDAGTEFGTTGTPFNISGTVTANLGSALPTGTNRIGVVTIGGGTVTIGAGTAQIGSVTASISGTVPISISSVTVGNSVTIGSLPAISGTVTANAGLGFNTAVYDGILSFQDNEGGFGIASLPAISGTVTANGGDGTFLVGGLRSGGKTALQLDTGTGYLQTKVESLPSLVAGTAQIGSVTASISNSLTISSLPAIAGTVTASVSNFSSIASDGGGNRPLIGIQLGFSAGEEDYRLVDPSNPLPVAASGTVTANSSNGSLTTRFGSVVTANTAFATSAVTNANRKYLLIQNITTASNVITVGIGFTPTTTQGIQLFAGAGLTFEGSYIPTGAVNLLSSVTASCFTILEA